VILSSISLMVIVIMYYLVPTPELFDIDVNIYYLL
jgi:hypothetical protein